MMSKMATIVLTYKLGLLSYGDSKLEKWKKMIKKTGLSFFKPDSSLTGFFICGKEC